MRSGGWSQDFLLGEAEREWVLPTEYAEWHPGSEGTPPNILVPSWFLLSLFSSSSDSYPMGPRLATSTDYPPRGPLLPFLPSLAIGKLGIGGRGLHLRKAVWVPEGEGRKAEVIRCPPSVAFTNKCLYPRVIYI